jgi:hypothetical protein
MLAAAPKEKVEKVGKAAAAVGATVAHAAPAAEAALGVSAYFGVLRVSGALTAASRRAKEAATRSFCRKHAFPAVAAAASPHVVVAAAAHCADVAAKVTTAAVAREAFAALVAALERPTPAPSDEMDEEETEEAWRVTREAASWAARAVVSEAPCAEEAFGESAYFESLAERLVARVEASPARGAAPLRALAALAEAASGAVAPAVAAALAARVAAAYAATLRRDEADAEDADETVEDETTLDAWETSVEAVAALCEAAETWEAPEEDDAPSRKKLHRGALVIMAATAAAHVRAYWEAAAALEPPCLEPVDDADGVEEAEAPPAHPAAAPILRFACETLAETVEGGDAVSATTASAVWSAAGAWASHLPAWRASDGDAILDDTALDALTAIVGAAVEAKAGETAIAAIALPAARAAACRAGGNRRRGRARRGGTRRRRGGRLAPFRGHLRGGCRGARRRRRRRRKTRRAKRPARAGVGRRGGANGDRAGPRGLDARQGGRGVGGGLERGGRGRRAPRRARRRVRFDAAGGHEPRRGRAGQASFRRDAHRGDAVRERARRRRRGGGG